MDSSSQVLIVILSVTLIVVALLGIVLLVVLIKIMLQIKHLSSLAERGIENVTSTAARVAVPAILGFALRGLQSRLARRRTRDPQRKRT